MKRRGGNRELLEKEYAGYRKVYRTIFIFYYAGQAVLFYFLCMQFAESRSLIPPSMFVFLKEAAAMAGIWYLFYLCDTKGGLLKLLRQWEQSLNQRLRREEAIETLMAGGIYFIDDWEMGLYEDFLVPKILLEKRK
jgi:hypothetical protein